MADRYWVGGTGTWDTVLTTNWSTTSGGSSGASVPTASDNVIFDQVGTYNVTMTGALTCLDFTVSAGTVSFLTGTSPTLSIYSSMSLVAGTIWTSTGTTTFLSTSTGKTITTNGTTISGSMAFGTGGGGGWSLGSALTLGTTMFTQLISGTLNLAGFTLTTGRFSSSNNNTRGVVFGTSDIVLTHTTAATVVVNIATPGFFTSTGTGGFVVNDMTVARTFSLGTSGTGWYNPPNLRFTTGASIATITTGSYFQTLDFGTTSFNPGTTTVIVVSLILSTSGTYTSLTVTGGNPGPAIYETNGTITSNGMPIKGLTINHNSTGFPGTTSLADAAVVMGVTTLTKGTLELGNSLLTGQFNSSNSNIRSIIFGTSDISLTVAGGLGAYGLIMVNATNFTWTGTGGFVQVLGSVELAFGAGTGAAGATSANAPNLRFATAATEAIIITDSWFNILDYTGTSYTVSLVVNLNGFILSSSGTYTSFSPTMRGTGTITNNGKTINGLTINSAGTTTLSAALSCSTFTQTAGTMDFATFNLTCSGGVTNTSGTLSNIGTISCTTWINYGTFTLSGGTITCTTFTVSGTFTLSGGTINLYTSFVLTSGSFTYNGGTLGAVSTFTHTAGTVTFNASYALTTTGTYTLTAGALILADGVILSTGIFSSTGTGTRSIQFGSASAGNINLKHNIAATTVLNMATATGFTYTGLGGFTVNAMSVTRTFTFGTTGGTISNAPTLTFTTGASVATLTTASWFNTLDFGTTSFNPGTTSINLNNLTLSSSGTYTSFSPTTRGTGTITNNGKTISALTINNGAGTTTLSAALSCSTFTQTAGTIDFGGLNLTCSSTATYTSGTLVSIGTLACTTFTINGPAFDFTSGTINPSTSFVLTSGSFTYNGGTLGAVPTFTHTAGTVTFNASYALTSTGTYALTAGALILADGVILSTGIFSSTGTGTRSIQFGSASAGNIDLTHTTAATTVLNMATVTGFTQTGPGGFTVAAMSNSRTFTFGTTGGTISNAPNLTFTTGASIGTITTGSWFNTLDFGTISSNSWGTSLNLNGFVLSSSGAFPGLSATMRGTGTINCNGIAIGSLTINNGAGTTTLSAAALSDNAFTMTAGTIDFGGLDLTCVTTATYTSGTLVSIGTITCTTFTINGPAFDFTSGTINPSTSFVLTSGSFTYNGGTLGAVPTFTHTAGTVTFNVSYALTTNGTYTLTAGSLLLAYDATLSTGIFSSSGSGVRSIQFGFETGPGWIFLTHTTPGTTVLNMATLTGFTWTGFYGFYVDDMSNTRTFSVGNTSGGSASNAPNLTFNTGASVATITTGSWFKTLDFGATSFNPGTTSINLNNLTLSGSGTYNSLSATTRGTGTITSNGITMGGLTVNHAGTTSQSYNLSVSTFTLTTGTMEFGGNDLTCSSTATYTGGTLSNFNSITCTTFTINGPAFNFTSGTINPSTSFVLTSGSFTYGNGGILGAVPTFTHTAGNVTFNASYALTATGTYTLAAGALILADAVTLSTGIFSSNAVSTTRSIAFGSASTGNINVGTTTPGITVLNIGTITNFSCTGSGGFTCTDMSVTRTMNFGANSGGTTSYAPNLSFPDVTGSATLTLSTTSGGFNNVDFGTLSSTVTGSLGSRGNVTFSSTGTYTGLGVYMALAASSNITLNTQEKTISVLQVTPTIVSPSYTGKVTFACPITITNDFYFSGGTIVAPYNISCGTFTAGTYSALGSPYTRIFRGSNTNLTVTGSGASAFTNTIQSSGFVMTNISSILMTSASAKTFAGGGGTYPTLNQGGAGILTISGTNSFADLTATTRPSTITFTISTTQTFTNFTLSGTAGNLVTINSSTPGSTATLSKLSGTVSVAYLSIRDSIATGGATWYAGVNSTNVSNNTGWIFTNLPNQITITDLSIDATDGGFTISNSPIP